MNLPPLPAPVEVARRSTPDETRIVHAYTTKQMSGYGALCWKAALEEAAKVCETYAQTDEEHARTGPSFAAAIRALAAQKV